MSFLPEAGMIVLYDTEFTSWAGFRERGFKAPGRYPEIIQIGAVLLNTEDDLAEVDAFEILVIPTMNRELSDYIIDLTGITQATLERSGVAFEDALSAFTSFVDGRASGLYSYGNDGVFLATNCELNGLPPPDDLPPECNVRRELAMRGIVDKRIDSSELPRIFGLEDEHPDHDALGDARSLATVLRHLRAQELI